jgi:diguanylate cyclase (GGDEF)-like protein
MGISEDITGRKAAEMRLGYLAHYDRLTELPNRELFYDRLSRAISQAKRKSECLAVFFLDLDGFKLVNDEYGHEAHKNY